MEAVECGNNFEIEKYGLKINIKFYGGTLGEKEKGVNLTGSSIYLHIVLPNGEEVDGLVDFGAFQGCDNALKYNEILPFDLSKLNFTIFTHSHIDHIGKALFLSKDEFKGTIWTTHLNASSMYYMLKDLIKINSSSLGQVNEVSKLKRKLQNYINILDSLEEDDESVIDPIKEEIEKIENRLKLLGDEIGGSKEFFDMSDLSKLMQKVNKIDFFQKVEVANDVQLVFIPAGHLPGSAQAILKIKGKNNKEFVIGFSGDLGRLNHHSLFGEKPLVSKEKVDLRIMDSTYGGREHTDYLKEEKKLVEAINVTVKNKGKIIIPAFVQNRAQEVFLLLTHLQNKGKIPKTPIYYHSDLIKSFFDLYSRAYPEDFKDLKIIPAIRKIDKKRKRNEFLERKESAILLTSGGMLTGGTIRSYFDLLQDPHNLFIAVGYQAENTLGREIFVNQKKEICYKQENDKLELIDCGNYKPGFYKLNINANLLHFKGFSGHADQTDLFKFISNLKFKPGAKIILNHGEKTPSQIIFAYAIKGLTNKVNQVLMAVFDEENYKKN